MWLYCTGDAGVTISAETYLPTRSLRFSAVTLDTIAGGPRVSCTLDDRDGALATIWYGTERPSGRDCELHFLIDGDKVLTVAWVCERTHRSSKGEMKLDLIGAGGLRPRAGLSTGTREAFPIAPEPGEAVQVLNGSFTFSHGYVGPPPRPGGHNPPYVDMAGAVNQPGNFADTPDPVLPPPPSATLPSPSEQQQGTATE